jgi:hypothetical protein
MFKKMSLTVEPNKLEYLNFPGYFNQLSDWPEPTKGLPHSTGRLLAVSTNTIQAWKNLPRTNIPPSFDEEKKGFMTLTLVANIVNIFPNLQILELS